LVDEVTGLLRHIHSPAFGFTALLHLQDAAHNDSQYGSHNGRGDDHLDQREAT
jgi:hypothetical protein